MKKILSTSIKTLSTFIFMKNKFYTLGFLIIILAISLFSQNIKLSGYVPYGVKVEDFKMEYNRIFNTIKFSSDIDTATLYIEYYKVSESKEREIFLPEWGGGGAIGKNRIVIPVDRKAIYRKNSAVTISHELTHIVINRISANVGIPRYFHEGIAMYLSGDVSFDEQSALSKALFTGSLMPLSSINLVNEFPQHRAQLAYAQSRMAIDYLVTNYDLDIISLILRASVKKGSFSRGLKEELDINEYQLDSLTQIHISKTYSSYFWILDNYILWIIIILLFLSAYILTIFRNRKKMKTMEEEERLEELKNLEG